MKMFYVNLRWPTDPVQEIEVIVRTGKKMVWAERANGRRHLIGSSVFQTLASAERARFALAEKCTTDRWTKWNRPALYTQAMKALGHTLH